MIKVWNKKSGSILGACALVLLSACGVLKDQGVGTLNSCHAPTPGTVAFAKTLQPEVQVKCSGCHGDNPQAPYQFAVDSASIGFSAAIGLVDLGNPGQSAIIAKVHTGHNCGDSVSCSETAESFTKQIAAWADLQNPKCVVSTPGGGGGTPTPTPVTESDFGLLTTNFTVLSTITTATDVTARWDLGDSDPALRGVMLEAKLRRVDPATAASPGSFSIKQLKIASATKAYQVATFKIILNDNDTNYLNFAGLTKLVAPMAFTASAATYPQPALGTQQQLVPMETVSDKLAFSFEIEEVPYIPTPTPSPTATPPPQIAEADQFNQDVRPILAQRCFGCHANVGAYLMPANNNVTLRANTVLKSNKTTPDLSLLLRKARGQVAHGGGTVLTLQTEIDRIKAWMIRIP